MLVWDDNSPVDYTNLALKQEVNYANKNKDICAAVRKSDLKWVFSSCNEKPNEFVCQINKVYKTINSNASMTTTKLTLKQTDITRTTAKNLRRNVSTLTKIYNTVLTTKFMVKNFTAFSTKPTTMSINTRKISTTRTIFNITTNKKFSTIQGKNLTFAIESSTTETLLFKNSTFGSTQPTQSNDEKPKGISAAAKVAIVIMAFAVFSGIGFGIYYIIKSNNIKFSKFFKSKPKTTEIALRENGIHKSEKFK